MFMGKKRKRVDKVQITSKQEKDIGTKDIKGKDWKSKYWKGKEKDTRKKCKDIGTKDRKSKRQTDGKNREMEKIQMEKR